MARAPPYRSGSALGYAVTHGGLISTQVKANRGSTRVGDVKVVGDFTMQEDSEVVSMLKDANRVEQRGEIALSL